MTDILIDTATVKALLAQSLRKELAEPGYNSPIKSIVESVIKEHESELTGVMAAALRDITSDEEFATILRQEAKHKMAKQLVAEITSSMGKAIQAFKNHPTMKADMIKAVESIINDHEAKASSA